MGVAAVERPILLALYAQLAMLGRMTSWWPALGARPEGPRAARRARSPQFRDGRFRNALPRHDKPAQALAGFMLQRGHREPKTRLPVIHRSTSDFAIAPDSGLRVTWLGHSTHLIELEGARFIVDPVFGPRASPSTAAGPKRFHPVPLSVAELPELDAVVLSHDHYDHLDYPTILALEARQPLYVAPLGLGAHLESWGVAPERIVEKDWWEEAEVAGVRLVATPARHFSGRSLGQTDATLWCGWAFVGAKRRAFFSGDTAMFPGFAEIGRRLGPFDVTLLESGAYNAAWADVHMGPEQAVDAHRALQGRIMLPVHWGTFNLSVHGWTEPVERVLRAAELAGVKVVTPRPGGSIDPLDPPEVERWWPNLPWQSAAEAPVVSSGLEPPTPEPKDHGQGPRGPLGDLEGAHVDDRRA